MTREDNFHFSLLYARTGTARITGCTVTVYFEFEEPMEAEFDAMHGTVTSLYRINGHYFSNCPACDGRCEHLWQPSPEAEREFCESVQPLYEELR